MPRMHTGSVAVTHRVDASFRPCFLSYSKLQDYYVKSMCPSRGPDHGHRLALQNRTAACHTPHTVYAISRVSDRFRLCDVSLLFLHLSLLYSSSSLFLDTREQIKWKCSTRAKVAYFVKALTQPARYPPPAASCYLVYLMVYPICISARRVSAVNKYSSNQANVGLLPSIAAPYRASISSLSASQEHGQ